MMSTPATLTMVQKDVFTGSCALSTVCHQGSSAMGDLNLEAGMSFMQAVNKASSEVPSKMRIVPGDPDHSYLMDKVLDRNLPTMPSGTVSGSCRCPTPWGFMPLGGPKIDATQMEELRSWIAAGAMNN